MQERAHVMHGTISVESKPGKGTKVAVVVPLASANPMSGAIAGEDEIASVAGPA